MREDFLSQQALGRPLRRANPETVRTYTGVSVFATAAQARTMAARFPALGGYIAEIEIPDDVAIHSERTFPDSEGHHTLWGVPDMMLRCVTRVEER